MEDIYTVKEAAKILGFSTNTIYKYLELGVIDHARGSGENGRFRIPHLAIEAFLGTTLSQDQVQKALHPAEYARAHTRARPHFPLLASRVLLFLALTVMIAEVILAPTFTLTVTLFRLTILTIFFLLAYQFGGFRK